MLLLVNFKPLIILALLGYAYWTVPRTLPYTVVFARRTIILVALLILPAVVYATVYGLAPWPHQTHVEVGVELIGAFGMFVGLICGAICFFKDARRTP
jgi:hypothetical protein